MQPRRRSTIIVVGGALAVASVGYGLGTQADGGTAVAGSDQTMREESRGGAGAAALADKLGVSADKLERAFRDFHESEEGDRRDEFAASLAKALGISQDKVTAAFDKLRPKHEERFESRRDRGDRGRHHAPPLRELAAALGVERADLSNALREMRA